MKLLKKIAKPFVKKIRELIRDYDDTKVPDDFSLNLKITKSSNLELNLPIPAHIKSLRIDIGLSHNAPNSAKWLKDRSDLFVIGIEANRYNAYKLFVNGMWSKNNPDNIISPYKSENFYIIYCAIDNVSIPTYSKFFHVKGDAGTSSLLEPTSKLLINHDYSIKNISNVPTVSLSCILEQVSWDRFDYIEVCKIDTQGKDLDILKSAKEFIRKIALISVEVDTFGQYVGAAKREDIYAFMLQNNFYEAKVLSNIENEVVDVLFANKDYESIIPALLDEI